MQKGDFNVRQWTMSWVRVGVRKVGWKGGRKDSERLYDQYIVDPR